MRPAFVRDGDRLYLLYQGGRPQSWSVLELSASGRALGRASALSALGERPVVSEDGGGLLLRWPASRWDARISLERPSRERTP